jgi:hypothetical protein
VDAAVKIIGLPADKVTVRNQYLGGAFGRRAEVDSVEQLSAHSCDGVHDAVVDTQRRSCRRRGLGTGEIDGEIRLFLGFGEALDE